MSLVKSDLKGRISNFSIDKKDVFLPVFEAIINSIHAIEEKSMNNVKNIGSIDIHVYRGNNLFEDRAKITGFKILDNGIGLNIENQKSFETLDSSKKLSIGGKGIGRVSWVKVFEKITVNSVFFNNKEYESVKYLLNDKDFIKEKISFPFREKNVYTEVILRDIKQNFDSNKLYVNSEELAEIILSNIVLHLINNPDIDIRIHEGKEITDLNLKFIDKLRSLEPIKFIIDDKHNFKLSGYFLPKDLGFQNNKINFTAQKRVVTQETLKIDTLPNEYIIEGESYYFNCFLESKYLDEDTTSERSTFQTFIYSSRKQTLDLDTSKIFELIDIHVKDLLRSYIDEANKVKIEQIKTFINDDENRQFSYLINDKNSNYIKELEKIPISAISNMSKLREHLVIIDDKKTTETIKDLTTSEYDHELHKDFLDRLTEQSISSLISYHYRRRQILIIFDNLLKYEMEKKYSFEQEIHNLIFPQNTDLKTINYLNHNLWLIDDRLSFSYRGTSEKKMKKIVPEGSNNRPDMFFFNAIIEDDSNGNSIVDHVLIIELKRPGSDRETTPKDQIYTYVEEIRNSGFLITLDGKQLQLSDNAVFSGFYISDYDDKLKKMLEKDQFKNIGNNGRWRFIDQNFKLEIEFIPYDDLYRSAVQRNLIFNKILKI